MKINMKVDETNELKELQQYLFHVFIQEAVVMKE